jgi:hypothetical protein
MAHQLTKGWFHNPMSISLLRISKKIIYFVRGSG